jgi:tetratricopeptide (TPR) repeat protein
MKKLLPYVERLLGGLSALVGLFQSAIGNWPLGVGLVLLGAALVVLGWRNARRLLTLEGCLKDEVAALVKDGHPHVAIRWVEASSRALWLSGQYQTRIDLGRLAITAADNIGIEAIRARIRALIDDCGWTTIELGRLEEGEKLLREGADLAKQHGWKAMYAKALRHIGGRCLREKDLKGAEVALDSAYAATLDCPSGPDQEELLAEWHYARGVLHLAQGNLSLAEEHTSKAEAAYAHLPSKEWRAKIHIRKGEIELRKNNTTSALGIFNEARLVAERHGYQRVRVKAHIALARLYIQLRQISEAKSELDRARRVLRRTPMLQEEQELAALQTKLRQHAEHRA